jgi:hypothetical protein
MEGEITNVIGQLTQVNGAIVGLTEHLPQIVTAFRQANEATLHEIRGALQAQQAGLDRMSRTVQTSRAGASNGLFGTLSYVGAGAAAVLLIVIAVVHYV